MSTSTQRPLSRQALGALAALLAAGLAVRFTFAFATYGVQYDMDSLRIVAHALREPGIGPYDTARWPYPGGFLPLLAAADWLSRHLGLAFHGVVKLPAIAADLGMAGLVLTALRRAGAGERRALAGAALVALGPSFIAISGYHGQIDAVATLPALAGLLVWMRGGTQRALAAGLLIGLGAAVKQPVALTALALLPDARSWRERGVLLALTAAVPLVSVAPFLIEDRHATVSALTGNVGVPGFGGLSAFAQPGLTRAWATLEGIPRPSSLTRWLADAQHYLVLAGALATTAAVWVRRVPPLRAAALIWLSVLVFNPNFAYQYVVWGLPFVIAAGHLRAAAIFQAAILPATLWLYWRPGLDPGGWPYLISIQAVWTAAAVTWVLVTLRLVRGTSERGSRSPRARAS